MGLTLIDLLMKVLRTSQIKTCSGNANSLSHGIASGGGGGVNAMH